MLTPNHLNGLTAQIQQFANVARGGWKVGLTSGASRDAMGAGVRPFGHIAQDRIFESGTTIQLSDVGSIGVENELCFLFDKPVPRDADRGGVAACVAAVKPAFELNQRRLDAAASDQERLADNLSQYGIVVGAAVPAMTQLKSLEVTLLKDGAEVATVPSAGHIDDHYDSLIALTRTLARFDLNIEAGDHVITGAYGRASVTEASAWRGEFSLGIGSVEVQFA